jgi:hypothetical protein
MRLKLGEQLAAFETVNKLIKEEECDAWFSIIREDIKEVVPLSMLLQCFLEFFLIVYYEQVCYFQVVLQ